MSEVVTVSGADFSGSAMHEGSSITVRIAGTADYAALDALEVLLTRTHAAAQQVLISEAVIDLRELEFMNSSGFKSFVAWIADIQAMDATRRYKLKFISNPKLHWQRRSLHSLRCFAVDLITVVEDRLQ